MLCALFRGLRRCLLLIHNTQSCFIHCNGSRLLVFIVEVRSRWHKSSYLKIVQRLRPNPNQLVGFNRKANSKERSHRESRDSKSDDSCNFHFTHTPFIRFLDDAMLRLLGEELIPIDSFAWPSSVEHPPMIVNGTKDPLRGILRRGQWQNSFCCQAEFRMEYLETFSFDRLGGLG